MANIILNSLQDIGRECYGEDIENSLDTLRHLVYKHTTCGASIQLIQTPRMEKVHRSFLVKLEMLDGKIAATGWLPNTLAPKNWRPFTHDDTPALLAEYLHLGGSTTRGGRWLDSMRLLLPDNKDIKAMRKAYPSRITDYRGRGHVWADETVIGKQNPARYKDVLKVSGEIQVRAQEPRSNYQYGVALSSIVEGLDAVVPPIQLYFPFTKDEFFEALESVEIQAQDIWDEANQDGESE